MNSVLLCTDYLPPSGGGVEVVVERLAAGLADRGVDVGVFTLGDSRPPLADVEGVTVYRASSIDLTELVGLQSQVSLAAVRRFRKIVQQHEPNVIHTHNRFFFTSLVATAWRTFTRTGPPLVSTLHLGNINDLTGIAGYAASGFEQTLGRWVVRTSDRVIAVSDAVASEARRLGAPAEQVHVVPNAVDSTEFRPPETPSSDRRVLFVGRLVRNKRPGLFLDAFADARETVADATADVIGSGPLAESLREQADALGVADVVRFHNRVERVAPWMRQATVFCRPSASEGMPLTLLEAMASEVPAIVTPVGGVAEVVSDGRTGCLVPVDNCQATTDSIVELLLSPDKRASIGEAAREYVVANHSWARRVEEVVALYDSLCSR